MATVLNTDYTRFTYQDMLEDFSNRLKADERFKNISSASIYGLFMEMIAASVDMTNFYMSRTAEEAFIDTARLDSSVIKHGKNLGYNPIRNTPAQAEIRIVLKGPLPSYLQAGAKVYFAQSETNLSFNNNPFMLDTDYSYTFTENDIQDGKSSSWTKVLTLSVPVDSVKYFQLGDYKMYQNSETIPIKIFQGKIIETSFEGNNNYRKLGKPFQFYDINDLKFSNWYGKRDPNGFYKNSFYPENSYTKVAIGKTKDSAFESGYFLIDDEHIYSNEKVMHAEPSELLEPLKVCSVSTNSDKTVRIAFGEGHLVNNGLNTEDENIYVEYLQTEGAEANLVGSTGAELTCNSKFFATQQGNIVDVTSNVKFIFNSDITGGVNFESKESIKMNAPAHYAANNKLVTKPDFVSYFKTLTTPIKVQNAAAWSVEDLEDSQSRYDNLLNYVFYCLAGQVYNINGKNNSYIDVLNENGYKNGIFSVYGNGRNYLNKLVDYVLLTKAPEKIYNEQYGSGTTEWQKRIRTIRENCEDRMLVNTKLFSMPPIVQYFDVVGHVEIDSLSKIQELKTEIENKIYAWLNDSCKFNQKIYKSDILKFFNGYNNIRSADLDIKVSELLHKEPTEYNFDKDSVYIAQDTDIASYLKNKEWNVIAFPITDNTGKKLTKEMFSGGSIIVKNDKSGDNRREMKLNPIYDKISESNNMLIVPVYGKYSNADNKLSWDFIPDLTSNNRGSDTNTQDYIQSEVTLLLNDEYDFSKTSNLNLITEDAYGSLDDATTAKAIIEYIANWIKNSTLAEKTSGRAIDLPYEICWIEDTESNVRKETIERRGNSQIGELKSQVNEHAFWYHAVQDLIYPAFAEQIKSGDYSNIERFVYDVYSSIKYVLTDSILDDNNNIVNFSLPNEIPVIRLNISYDYRK